MTTLEKIREEWQNEHIKACEVNAPKHLLKRGPLGLQPWLQASGTVQICLLCVPLAVKQQDVLQLTLGVCLKLGFWIQGPTASGFLLFFYCFYFPPPFKTGRVNVVTFLPVTGMHVRRGCHLEQLWSPLDTQCLQASTS